MFLMTNAIDHRVAHVEVWRSHVDLRAQRLFAISKFPRSHTLEEIKILLRRPVAAGAFLAGLLRCASVFFPLIRLQLTHVGLAILNQLHGVPV